MRRVLLAALAALVLPALLSGRAQAIPYSFTTIDEPNATPRGGDLRLRHQRRRSDRGELRRCLRLSWLSI